MGGSDSQDPDDGSDRESIADRIARFDPDELAREDANLNTLWVELVALRSAVLDVRDPQIISAFRAKEERAMALITGGAAPIG